MDEEILACVEEKDIQYLHSGQISKYIFPMERIQAHKKKIPHLIVRFFIVSFKSENEILFLVQKRGNNKESYPGFFTDSASGHVVFEQNLDLTKIKNNAIRELEEEFGILKKAIKKIIFYDLNVEEDKFTKEIAYIFLGIVNKDAKLNPNPEEIDPKESMFYSKSELNEICLRKSIDYSKKIWEKIISSDVKEMFQSQKIVNTTEKFNTGLFIGRFQPLHHGHIYVIKRILELCNRIKIGIGSSQISNNVNDPFTSEERKKFIEAAMKKRNIPLQNYEVFEIPDIFNANKWVDHVTSIVGNFDVAFSNSDWVRQLFESKGIKIGKKLEIFKNKFNGTNVRNLIVENDKKLYNLVPKEVITLMEKFNGIERMKHLWKNPEKRE